MDSAFPAGIALWFAYGILITAWQIVIANTITLLLAVGILGMRVGMVVVQQTKSL